MLLFRHFAKNWEEKFFPNDPSILSNLKNAKAYTYPHFHFSTKKESIIILEMKSF